MAPLPPVSRRGASGALCVDIDAPRGPTGAMAAPGAVRGTTFHAAGMRRAAAALSRRLATPDGAPPTPPSVTAASGETVCITNLGCLPAEAYDELVAAREGVDSAWRSRFGDMAADSARAARGSCCFCGDTRALLALDAGCNPACDCEWDMASLLWELAS